MIPCPVPGCGKSFDRERGLKSHMTRSHKDVMQGRSSAVRTKANTAPIPKLTPGMDGDITDALIARIPATEEELTQSLDQVQESQAQQQAEREAQIDEEKMLRRIKISQRLNKYVAKLTTTPIESLIYRMNDARNEGQPFEPEEQEAITDSLEIFSELVGLEFEIDPLLWVIKSIWVALAFSLIMPFYVTLARPGLRNKKEEEVKS